MNTRKLLCLVSTVALCASALGQTQSLADLAKQEKARQAKARASGPAAKVYTDEVKTAPASPATVSAGSGEGKPAPAAAPLAKAKVPSDVLEALRKPQGGRPDARSNRDVQVTMYMTSWCPYCRKAAAFLATLPNVRVVAHNIEENPARNLEMLSKSGGDKGIPLIDVQGMIIHGFSESAITRAIADARRQ